VITSENLGSLKQVNISQDAEKTKARAEQLWKEQSNAKKKELTEFAGCIPATIHRIYKTGAIHIKLTLAFAQMLNINPYYLTGEADEPGEFSDVLLLQLLEQHGYKQLAEELTPPAPVEEEVVVKPKRKYTRKSKPVVEEEAPAAAPEAEAERARSRNPWSNPPPRLPPTSTSPKRTCRPYCTHW